MDKMHREIQKLFIDGVNEVFDTLFNDGKEEGVYFYPQIEQTKNVYQEVKGKVYGDPALLVARVQIDRIIGEDSINVKRGSATFTVPLKSLMANNIDVSENNYTELEKGIMKYKDSYFTIERIQPTAFVEQVFLLYNFTCRECLYSDLEEIGFFIKEDEFEESVDLGGEDSVE